TYVAPVGTDNCSGQSTVQTAGLPSGSAFPKGKTTNTFEVTDASGNKTSCTFDVTINDTEAPAITCPGNIVQSTDTGLCSAVVTYVAPVGTDNCSGQSTVQTAGLPSGSAFPKGKTTNTFEVTDASGNKTSCSFDVTINDTEAPVITCPGNIVQSTDTGLCSAVVTYVAPVGTDNCSGQSTVQTAGLPSGSAFPKGKTTNTFEVTDASGNKTSCSFDVVVIDNEKPKVFTQNIILQLDATGNVSTTAAAVNNGSSDNCGIASLSLSKTDFNCSNFGDNTVTLTVTDVNGNSSTATATVTVEGYAVIDTHPQSTELVYGCDAPILNVAAHVVGTGTLSYQWYKNTTNSNSGGTLIVGETSTSYQTPHNYNVGDYYYYAVVTTNSCSVASDVAKVAITPQTASAVGDIYYTGPIMAWTTSSTSNTATVTLAATIKNSKPCGDIRTARVTFTVNGQPISSAQNLPVGFIDPNHPALGGTASAIVQLNIANNATSDLFDIGVIISGNYATGNFVPGVVTVIKPKPGGVIGGAVALCNDNATGYVKGTGKANLNFYVEYAMKGKSVSNPKGKVSLCVSSYNKPDGTIDNVPHWYLIKSNAIASLNITSPTATFSGKANIAEMNSLTGELTPIEGNCQMVLDLKDAGNTTGSDLVGITIQRNGGGIWYSNNWVSTKTVMASICGGDLNVSGAPSSGSTTAKVSDVKSVATFQEENSTEPTIFSVIAYPNPSSSVFTIEVAGNSTENVQVLVYDSAGKLLKVIDKKAGDSISFGEDLPRGTYIAKITQGVESKTVNLIKK
ncbi:HYR domain-containing protein, partial [Flavobacterium flavipallidum]